MRLFRLRQRPKPIVVFVFGSNVAGRHGAGAARHALIFEQAVYGRGEGMQGTSYAIPTKDEFLHPRTLVQISRSVQTFLDFARENKDKYEFHVTPIGCGNAGYRPSQIAPMFRGATSNVKLPEVFKLWLK